MDVEDGLACGGARVHNHSVPVLGDPLFSGQIFCHEEHFPHEIGVALSEFAHRCDVLPGDEEDVGGSLRMEVPECHHLRVGVNQICRDLSLGNAAEKAIGIGQGVPLSASSMAPG